MQSLHLASLKTQPRTTFSCDWNTAFSGNREDEFGSMRNLMDISSLLVLKRTYRNGKEKKISLFTNVFHLETAPSQTSLLQSTLIPLLKSAEMLAFPEPTFPHCIQGSMGSRTHGQRGIMRFTVDVGGESQRLAVAFFSHEAVCPQTPNCPWNFGIFLPQCFCLSPEAPWIPGCVQPQHWEALTALCLR